MCKYLRDGSPCRRYRVKLNTRVRSNFTSRQETYKIDSRIMPRSWKKIPQRESDCLMAPLNYLLLVFSCLGVEVEVVGSGSREDSNSVRVKYVHNSCMVHLCHGPSVSIRPRPENA